MKHHEWESEVATGLSIAEGMAYSDAMGIIEANTFYMAQAWGRGLTPAETVSFLREKLFSF